MATANFQTTVNKIYESPHTQPKTGLTLVNRSRDVQSPDGFKVIKEYLLQHYGPVLRHKEMIKALSIGRSKSYEMAKKDPSFPKGIPLFDSENSPKIYSTHDVIAWLEARYQQFNNLSEDI
jgi:predicted DNA-binding transcriptional regulator AlpA